MHRLLSVIPMLGDFILILCLVGILLAALPTAIEVMRHGNAADPLRREIEEEDRRRRIDKLGGRDKDQAA